MEIKVKALYDVSKVVVPKELTEWKVTEEQVQEHLNQIARLAADTQEASVVEKGDCVKCSCTEGALAGREVLIYPGLKLPGAEQAEEAVLSLTAGSEFTVELNGEEKLKVEQILRRIPAAVDDNLIQRQAIDGVTTVDEYCSWYRKNTEETNRTQALKLIQNYYIQTITDHSEFEYDQAEMDELVERQLKEQLAYEMEMTGEKFELSEEELMLAKEQMSSGQLRSAVEQAMCNAAGIVLTPDMFEEELKAIAAEMPGMEDMMDEYRELYLNQAYAERAVELIDEQAKSCLEVE